MTSNKTEKHAIGKYRNGVMDIYNYSGDPSGNSFICNYFLLCITKN